MAKPPKIERGIPMPKKGLDMYGWIEDLEVGDSFLYPSSRVGHIRAHFHRLGRNIASRRVKSNEHRVWRIK